MNSFHSITHQEVDWGGYKIVITLGRDNCLTPVI